MQHATVAGPPSTGLQALVLVPACVLAVAYVALVVRWLVFPIDSSLSTTSSAEAKLKAVEFERERVGALAKGLAGGAAGFLSALLLAILKDEVSETLSTLTLLGILAGAVGLLTSAACLSRLLARHVSSALESMASAAPPP